MFLKNNFSKFAIVFLILVCSWYGKNLDTWGRNKVIDNDVVSYYAYLPAGLLFHDLDFKFIKDLPPDFEGKIWLATAPTGKPVIRMTMGLAILWIPFFVSAHLAAKYLGVSALGYSWPYSLSIFVAAIFYLFLGLIFLRKILRAHFSEIITGLVLLIIVLGTNLMYYVISEPGMSHVYSFSLITIFLYIALKWVERPGLGNTFLLGFLSGMIVLVRPVNGLVLIFPALIGVHSFRELFERISDRRKYILIAGIAAVVAVLPQIIYWKMQTGQLFFNSYMDSGRFFFRNPHILDGLFSFRKGWFVYTPVMAFACFGLFSLKGYFQGIIFSILTFLALFVYVIFSWWCWWYGGSFGSRPMIETYGILAIPLAALLSWLVRKPRWLKIILGALIIFFVFLNQFQMSQYRTSLLHWDSMTKEAYFGIFLKEKWPPGYDKMIKIPDYEKALRGRDNY